MGNQCCCAPPKGDSQSDCCNSACCKTSCCLSIKRCWRNMFSSDKAELHMPTMPDPEERPKPAPQDDVTNKKFLSITGYDWCREKMGAEHHTAEYHIMTSGTEGAVCRRGQSLQMLVRTNRRYVKGTDKVGLLFTVKDCKNPSFGNGTMMGVSVEADFIGGWKVQTLRVDDDCVTLELTPPVNCIIGAWTVEFDILSEGEAHNFVCPKPLYVLFNPWCEDDSTYISTEEERKEYVLQDSGLIWRGTSTRLRPCAWYFAQFDENILECVLYILKEVCKVSPANRADPVKVSRAISAGINSPDDKGVLVGNWSGEYDGGVCPTQWNGSNNILAKYYETKEPVKFGQCWVFSGIVATACRAIGLPCRPVTNFSSAHDTHNSLTIDYFFDDEGEVIERLNSDSIWNFHVWNEVWMKRPDLGVAHNGWQCIDATPQEESDGQYRCGPTSLHAVKKGEIHLPYDVPFVFSEVNADKLYWKYRGKSQPMKLIGRKTHGVGLKVSTKEVGRYRREDITHLYKHEEDSKEERDVMKDALRRCENVFARYYLNEEIEDVEFDFQLIDDIVIGQPFSMCVIITNKSDRDQEVSVLLRADSTMYTGAVKDCVKREKFDKTIKANSEEKVSVDVPFEEYYSRLVDQCALNIACLCKVKETEFDYYAQDDFRMRKPDIKITPMGSFKCGQPTTLKLSFTNPIPMALNRGFFYVIANKCKSQYMRIREPSPANGEVCTECVLTPNTAGEITINASYMSKELEDVDGYLVVEVASVDGTRPPTPTTPDDKPGDSEAGESVEMNNDRDDAKSEAGSLLGENGV